MGGKYLSADFSVVGVGKICGVLFKTSGDKCENFCVLGTFLAREILSFFWVFFPASGGGVRDSSVQCGL